MWHVYLKTTGSLVFCRCGNSKELYDELTQLSETVAIYSTGQIKPLKYNYYGIHKKHNFPQSKFIC